MRSNKNTKPKLKLKPIIICAFISVIIAELLILLSAAFILKGKIDEAQLKIAFIIISIISGLCCGMISKSVSREGGSVAAVLSALISHVIMTALCLLLPFGRLDLSLNIQHLGIMTMACFIGCKIDLAKSNKKLRKRRKR